MEEVQITAAQTEISENIQSILNGQTRNDVEFQRQESLKHLSCSDRQIGSCGKVDKRHNLSLQEFLDVYDGKWPVIVTDVMSAWPAINWTADFFKKEYGRSRVTMTTCANSERTGFSVPLEIFLDHLHLSTPKTWTYLQDELFLIQHPELRAHILQPIYTEEDFFQLLPASVRPWDCMLLWGTAHSRSSLHIDPYNWTGTNAVISGLKRWKLLPPGQDQLLSVRPGMRCGFPLECVKYNSDLDLFDSVQLGNLPEIKYVEVDQGPGEMLFIPPGWFHQAYNAVPTLAVSGQMMNSNNYQIVLEEMFKGGNFDRSALPKNIDLMAPKNVVKVVSAQIPQHVLEEGLRRTEEAIQQLHVPSQL
ncbi:hypothetical protein RRG08_032799 [Elysia crispata]|uniref:JmjC domain-containing protein n=1 Tax=Elysia crispata TaxID=231223 RepID=A0AAE1D215_9GAST|nr:hypothetical protein RRG08_032799 [Elysia crispata]